MSGSGAGTASLAAMSIPLAWLNLSTRAVQLTDKVRAKYLGDLVGMDPGELRRRPNVGAKTISELEAWLAKAGLSFSSSQMGWRKDDAKSLVASSGDLVAELAEKLNNLGSPAITTLEAALRHAVAQTGASSRNVDLILDYLGWSGCPPKTLEAVGSELGITRERVRQIVAKATARMRARPAPFPLRKAAALVRKAIPIDRDGFAKLMAAHGLGDEPFSPGGLQQALELYRLEVPFELDGRQALIPTGAADAVQHASVLANRIISARGCVHIDDLVEAEPILQNLGARTVAFVLDADPRYQWLDDEHTWLWRGAGEGGGRNRLVNTIIRVMAVARRVELSELRTAIRRNLRMEGFAPPLGVLREVCASLPFVEVADQTVCRVEGALAWNEVLGSVERTLADVLKEYGPVMSRLEFLEKCLQRGMNINTFGVFGTYSVVISRPASGLYSLVGAEIPPGTIEEIKQLRERASAFVDSGWTQDGQPFLCWKISNSILYNGIATIPSSMQRVLQGQWSYRTRESATDGQLEVRESTCWNVRKLLLNLGAEIGDLLAIWFDLETRTVRAMVGSDELAEVLSAGAPTAPVRDDELEEL
jgi:hypothetical protein